MPYQEYSTPQIYRGPTGRGVGQLSYGIATGEELPLRGFVDVSPQVHSYLQSIGKDVQFTPLYYNPEKKLYANFWGRGVAQLQTTPHLAITAPSSSNFLDETLAALDNLKFPLAVFTAGGTFATNAPATQTVTTTTAENTVDFTDLVDPNTGFSTYPDISPDLIDTPYTPFSTNPSLADLEAGGEGGGLPGITPNVASYPDLKTIATGAKTVLELYTADQVAKAQVARAQAAAATPRRTPTSLLPNFASFLSGPGGSLPTNGTSGATSVSMYVIAGIILIAGFLFLKR